MPPKKQPFEDKGIWSSFKMKSEDPGSSSTQQPQPGGAAGAQSFIGCQGKVKGENCVDVGHSHKFTVKFSQSDCKEYTVHCHQPCRVLEAIKSTEKYKEKVKCADENIIIQLGKEDKECIVATHFPCSSIEDGECLVIFQKPERTEKAPVQQHQITHSRESYSVFYIDREGGRNTKSKELFMNSAVKKFKKLAVYGEKGTTVEDALKRDGRFIDDLGKFELSDNENPNILTHCTQLVDTLDQKSFKICLPVNKRRSDEKKEEKEGASNNLQNRHEPRSVSEIAEQSGISIRKLRTVSDSENIGNIYEILRQQFPDLKKWMKERFSVDYYEKEVTIKKENFGKIQQSFSEVHRVRKLLKLGESICKVVVADVCQGTGFVLFDNFILTNAHLFTDHFDEKKFQVDVDVSALFNYDEPEPETKYYYFTCKKTLIDFDVELDYAILELDPGGREPNQKGHTKKKVPPGLLKKLGPVPPNGEACIIGHPEGGVKKMDLTFIIEKERREEAIDEHLQQYKGMFTILSIIQMLTNQGVKNIMTNGKDTKRVVTYNTFMYHGSSGSPLFDACGQVVGLHTAGYTYGFTNRKEHVIEYAHPVLSIFRKFVSKLNEKGKDDLFKRVEKEAQENKTLREVLEAESADPEKPMDTD